MLIGDRPDLSLLLHWRFEQAAINIQNAIDNSRDGIVVMPGKKLSLLEARVALAEVAKRSDERYERFVDTMLFATSPPVGVAFFLLAVFWVVVGFRGNDQPR